MKNSFNDVFVSVIKIQIADNRKLVTFLMDLLSLGKESIYRRLRSEIPFTMEEVLKISIEMGLSLDNIAAIKNTHNALFDLDLSKNKNAVELGSGAFTEQQIRFLKEIGEAKTSKYRLATNRIPFLFLFNHEKLLNFVYYKWFHHTEHISPLSKYCDFSIPKDIKEVHEKIVHSLRGVKSTLFILDKGIFQLLIQDIEYFYKRNLITATELEQMRKEMYNMVADFEKHADGTAGDNNIQLYLSPVFIDGIYTHFEYDGKERSQIGLYSIDVVITYNPKACIIQKEWIDSLKRYSTLISQSGEMQRFEFFNRQRKYITNMGAAERNSIEDIC